MIDKDLPPLRVGDTVKILDGSAHASKLLLYGWIRWPIWMNEIIDETGTIRKIYKDLSDVTWIYLEEYLFCRFPRVWLRKIDE